MKTSTIIAIVVVILLVGIWLMSSRETTAPSGTETAPAETTIAPTPATTAEEQEVDAVSAETNIDAEFQAIDKDLEQL